MTQDLLRLTSIRNRNHKIKHICCQFIFSDPSNKGRVRCGSNTAYSKNFFFSFDLCKFSKIELCDTKCVSQNFVNFRHDYIFYTLLVQIWGVDVYKIQYLIKQC